MLRSPCMGWGVVWSGHRRRASCHEGPVSSSLGPKVYFLTTSGTCTSFPHWGSQFRHLETLDSPLSQDNSQHWACLPLQGSVSKSEFSSVSSRGFLLQGRKTFSLYMPGFSLVPYSARHSSGFLVETLTLLLQLESQDYHCFPSPLSFWRVCRNPLSFMMYPLVCSPPYPH